MTASDARAALRQTQQRIRQRAQDRLDRRRAAEQAEADRVAAVAQRATDRRTAAEFEAEEAQRKVDAIDAELAQVLPEPPKSVADGRRRFEDRRAGRRPTTTNDLPPAA